MAEHPITPPHELVQQWLRERPASEWAHGYLAAQAANWGADQELEACCEWIDPNSAMAGLLRTARRSKPPTLKELALEGFERVLSQLYSPEARKGLEAECKTIRRALQELPE